jgi:4-hydroxybenzoate polyprenyltransferase
VKNAFVLLGVVFSHQWDTVTLTQAAFAFAAFCLMASAVYVFNDLLDVDADRAHPTKRLRPIASGQVPPGTAKGLAALLCAGGMVLAWMASPAAALIVGTYAAMNVLYSIRLKHIVIVDVFTIALGFMLRILAGTIGLGIDPSSWLLLCGMMITLFLGFAKRRAELLATPESAMGEGRKVLTMYKPVVLEQYLSITAGCAVITYALYTVAPETVQTHGTDRLVYTVPVILYGIFRYFFLLHSHGKGQDTSKDLFRDRHLLATAVAWLGLVLWFIW